jgi:hypothetical protein
MDWPDGWYVRRTPPDEAGFSFRLEHRDEPAAQRGRNFDLPPINPDAPVRGAVESAIRS